jgi:hypothetical protein
LYEVIKEIKKEEDWNFNKNNYEFRAIFLLYQPIKEVLNQWKIR